MRYILIETDNYIATFPDGRKIVKTGFIVSGKKGKKIETFEWFASFEAAKGFATAIAKAFDCEVRVQ